MNPLDRLDAALIAARHWVRRPGHRQRFWAHLGAVELTTIRVLRAVEGFGGDDPTIGDVAGVLGVAPSTASRLIDQVVERGELMRRRCADDGRRTRLVVTPAGWETLSAVTDARRHVLAEVTVGWEASDIALLADLLERLGEGFDTMEEGR